MRKTAAVENSSYGFVWNPPPGLRPALVNAIVMARSRRWLGQAGAHGHWVLDFNLTDYGRSRAGRSGEWVRRPPNMAHLYPPGMVYSEDLRGAPLPIREAWDLFTCGEAAGLDRLLPRSGGCARFMDPERRIAGAIQAAAQIGRAEGDAGFLRAQARLFEIFDLLVRSEPAGPGVYRVAPECRPEARAGGFLESARSALRADLRAPLRLEEAARRMNMSVSSLCHRFRAEGGEAPMTYRMRARIELAKTLALKGLPLKRVAEETGFFDAYHLSKAFKKAAGMAPRDYLSQSLIPARPGLTGACRESIL